MFSNLVDIERLSKEEILFLMDTAKGFKFGELRSNVRDKTVAMMFFENSTRTKCSFEMAAFKLGLNIINFDTAHSSLAKGESLKDTVENLSAIGVDAVVIRHGEAGIIQSTLSQIATPMKFLNAGEGNYSHPTQALLDCYTMIEKLGSINGKTVTIVGDIRHSRVAKSNIALLSKFDVDINVCAPEYFMPSDIQNYPVNVYFDLKKAIKDSDVIMALRVQNERHVGENYPDVSEYISQYQLNSEIFRKYSKPEVILMHPGPVNRDIEISSELLDSSRAKTILEQASNGVFVRMAVFNTLLSQCKEVSFAS